MNGYEKMLSIMEKRGKKGSEEGVRAAAVGNDFSVTIGELTLEKDDLIFSQELLTGYTDAKGSPVPPIGEGDTVLVKRISDEVYAVIAKLVEKE